MRYNVQKKVFYVPLFAGMPVVGYKAGTVGIPLALAAGVLLP